MTSILIEDVCIDCNKDNGINSGKHCKYVMNLCVRINGMLISFMIIILRYQLQHYSNTLESFWIKNINII